jgi:hypothetical protein
MLSTKVAATADVVRSAVPRPPRARPKNEPKSVPRVGSKRITKYIRFNDWLEKNECSWERQVRTILGKKVFYSHLVRSLVLNVNCAFAIKK